LPEDVEDFVFSVSEPFDSSATKASIRKAIKKPVAKVGNGWTRPGRTRYLNPP